MKKVCEYCGKELAGSMWGLSFCNGVCSDAYFKEHTMTFHLLNLNCFTDHGPLQAETIYAPSLQHAVERVQLDYAARGYRMRVFHMRATNADLQLFRDTVDVGFFQLTEVTNDNT
jgi:hypothetical protein